MSNKINNTDSMVIKCPVCDCENRRTMSIVGTIPNLKYRYFCTNCTTIYDCEMEIAIKETTIVADGTIVI